MKATHAPILNRSGQIPKDGWYQIEVSGTHPAGKHADGRNRRQVIDDKAIESIVNRFNAEKAAAGEDWAGMLVDLDHLSHDLDNSTEAFAWLHEVEIRNRQLWGRLELTDLGEPAVRNKRVKFFSTEYDPADLEDLGNGDVRPLRLSGLAFTNRPNNRGGKPISNRTGDEPDNPTPQTKTTMKSVAEKLGLPAEADEAAILAKITAIMSENETMKAKSAETEADAVMNTLGSRIPKEARDQWRKRLIANRAEAEELIKISFPVNPTRDGKKPIFNREDATAPEPVEGAEQEEGGKPTAAEKKNAAAIRNRAHFIQKSEGISYPAAFGRAQAELS